MKRFEISTAGQLQIGDTFYQLNDKTKTVFERIEGKTVRTKYATYSVLARERGNRYASLMKSNTAVVFLREGEFRQAQLPSKDGNNNVKL